MQYQRLTPLAIAAAGILFSASGQADEGDTAQVVAALDPVVVTAARTPRTVDESMASVSVITRDEIEQLQPESLPDLLQRTQGLEITRTGSRGANTSLFMRGTNNDHVLVLVDGQRIGASTTNQTSLEALPINNIERIEVVRGPRSALYGADAIGGVIQIFTRDAVGPRGSIGAGSDNLRTLSAGHGARSDQGAFHVDFSAESTDGFDTRENDCEFCPDEPDDDGFESASLSMRGERVLTPDLTLRTNGLAVFSENEFDGNPNESKDRQYAAGIELDWAATRAWNTRMRVSVGGDKSRNFKDGEERNQFQTDHTQVTWQNDIDLDDSNLLIAGVEARREDVGGSNFTAPDTEFAETSRDTEAVFAQHQWYGDRASFEQALRHEDIEGFDRQTTGSVGAGYRLAPRLRGFVSWGSAFRAPSFNELFFPGFGNPDLEPERSHSSEVGLRGRLANGGWETSIYQTDIDQLIQTVQDPDSGQFAPENVDEARIRGIEVSLFGSWAPDWRGNVNLGYKEPKDRDSGNLLPRRARETVNAGVTRTLGQWRLGADVTGQGKRFNDAANETELDAYALLNLRAGYRMTRNLDLRFHVRNATDKDYTLVDTYNTEGRAYFVQLSYRPGGNG